MTVQPQLPFVAPRWFRHGDAVNLTRTPCGLCVEVPETLTFTGWIASGDVQLNEPGAL